MMVDMKVFSLDAGSVRGEPCMVQEGGIWLSYLGAGFSSDKIIWPWSFLLDDPYQTTSGFRANSATAKWDWSKGALRGFLATPSWETHCAQVIITLWSGICGLLTHGPLHPVWLGLAAGWGATGIVGRGPGPSSGPSQSAGLS